MEVPSIPKIVLVTGDYAKTSTVNILIQLLSEEHRVGSISSLGVMVGKEYLIKDFLEEEISKKEYRKLLKKLITNNLDYIIIEANIERIDEILNHKALFPDLIVLTDISTSRVDVSQFQKLQKLDKTKRLRSLYSQFNSLNHDFLSSLKESGVELLSSTLSDIKNISYYLNGIEIELANNERHRINIAGKANVKNLILSVNAFETLTEGEWKQHLSKIKHIPGRFEFHLTTPYNIIIDIGSHLDGIYNALSHIKNTKLGSSKIISVFGAKSKNYSDEITKVFKNYSDLAIVSSFDLPDKEISDMNSKVFSGAGEYGTSLVERFNSQEEFELVNKETLKKKLLTIRSKGDIPFVVFDEPDFKSRLNAIELAILLSEPDDVIYIAGKGTENVIQYKDSLYEWSDHEAVNQILKKLNVNKIR